MDKIAISVIPGLFLVFTYRILETISYLSNSGTNVIEKIVINLIYILGFAVPRFLIWEKLKYGVSLVSKDVAGHFDTEWFQEFQSTMSVLEQIALAYVWDSVRASSQCIQLNNCGANDFLEHLTRMKISTCTGSDGASMCELLYNDSPLILLSVLMSVLTILSLPEVLAILNQAGPNQPLQPGDGINNRQNMIVHKSIRSEQSQRQGLSENTIEDNSVIRPNQPLQPDDGNNNQHNMTVHKSILSRQFLSQGLSANTREDNSVKHPSPRSTSHEDRKSSSSPWTGMTRRNQNEDTSKDRNPCPNPTTQRIAAKCPKCCRDFHLTVPRPWSLSREKCASCPKNTRKSKNDKNRRHEIISRRVINDLHKETKCKYCKEELKKKLKEILEEYRRKGE